MATARGATVLGALTGVDPRDPKTAASSGHFFSDYRQFVNVNGLAGARIGIAELEGWNGRARASLKTLLLPSGQAIDTPDALRLRNEAPHTDGVLVAERRLTGVMHAAGAGACSWYDLAVAAFERAATLAPNSARYQC